MPFLFHSLSELICGRGYTEFEVCLFLHQWYTLFSCDMHSLHLIPMTLFDLHLNFHYYSYSSIHKLFTLTLMLQGFYLCDPTPSLDTHALELFQRYDAHYMLTEPAESSGWACAFLFSCLLDLKRRVLVLPQTKVLVLDNVCLGQG